MFYISCVFFCSILNDNELASLSGAMFEGLSSLKSLWVCQVVRKMRKERHKMKLVLFRTQVTRQQQDHVSQQRNLHLHPEPASAVSTHALSSPATFHLQRILSNIWNRIEKCSYFFGVWQLCRDKAELCVVVALGRSIVCSLVFW